MSEIAKALKAPFKNCNPTKFVEEARTLQSIPGVRTHACPATFEELIHIVHYIATENEGTDLRIHVQPALFPSSPLVYKVNFIANSLNSVLNDKKRVAIQLDLAQAILKGVDSQWILKFTKLFGYALRDFEKLIGTRRKGPI